MSMRAAAMPVESLIAGEFLEITAELTLNAVILLLVSGALRAVAEMRGIASLIYQQY